MLSPERLAYYLQECDSADRIWKSNNDASAHVRTKDLRQLLTAYKQLERVREAIKKCDVVSLRGTSLDTLVVLSFALFGDARDMELALESLTAPAAGASE